MSEKRTTCIKCEAPITQEKGGRPRVYCGLACRGAAAYELRRLTRHLERLEAEAIEWRRRPASKHRDYFTGRTTAEQLAVIKTEIERSETRLRTLLAEGTDELTVEPERATRAVKGKP